MHCQCFYSAVRADSKLDYSIHNVEMPSIFCLFPLLARIAECSLPESQNAWELQTFPESQNVWKYKKLQVSSGFQICRFASIMERLSLTLRGLTLTANGKDACSEFVFFSSNRSFNHIKIEKCLLLFATNTNILTLLFKELKTDGKSFIFAVCRLT